MKYSQRFNSLSSANGFKINYLPFTGAILNGLKVLNLRTHEKYQKIEIEDNKAIVVDRYKGLKFISHGLTTISMQCYSCYPDMKYSLDIGETWTLWNQNYSYIDITLNDGDLICFKGNNPSGFSTSSSAYAYFIFGGSGIIEAKGNIMSLIDDGACLTLTIPSNYCFYNLFYNCNKLISAPALPATTLALYCYSLMFKGCSSLTSAPELPATTLANYCYSNMFEGCSSLTNAPELLAITLALYCYNYMFSNCTSLTNAPELPAIILALYCYSNMFYGCTSLTNVPELPATTLALYCYSNMFKGCTSLTNAPELPATILALYCYRNMFDGCTSLTNAPELPATTLINSCYFFMFNGCTSLTNAPELPATTLINSCYNSMFYGCSNLNYIKCLATSGINENSSTNYWITGADSGIFVKDPNATWPTGNNGIPSGWTVQDAAA